MTSECTRFELLKNLFIKDLMQDIRNVSPIKDGDDERLMDYYVTLQAHIEEAHSAGALGMLLIPGFVFTALTARGRMEKPPAAWTPGQTVAFLFDRVAAGDFYILCPDNDVPRALDERRILWAAGDIVENRPALSRWHPDYAEAFAEFSRKT